MGTRGAAPAHGGRAVRPRGSRLLAWSGALCALVAACGERPPASINPLPVAIILQAGQLEPVTELTVPSDGEVFLEPRELLVRLPPLSGAGWARPRTQVVVRIFRHDGGVRQWLPAGESGAPPGEGARRTPPGAEAAPVSLAPARLGPLLASRVAAIEVGITLLPDLVAQGTSRAGAFVGGAAVHGYPRARAGGDGGDSSARRVPELVADGVALVAVRLPIIAHHASTGASSTRRSLSFEVRAGEIEVALALDIRIEVEDHAQTAPASPPSGD